MLHAELQSRIYLLLSLRWSEVEEMFPGLAIMIDRDVMAACATSDLQLSSAFTHDITRAHDCRMKFRNVNRLLSRHLERWLGELCDGQKR